MDILFVVNSPYLPDSVNGAALVCHELACLLNERGEHVSVAALLSRRGRTSLRLRIGRKVFPARSTLPDGTNGYPTFRSWNIRDAIDHAAARRRPDVAVIHAGEIAPACERLQEMGIPVVCYHHGLARLEEESFKRVAGSEHLVVSRFLRDRLISLQGYSAEVVHPFALPSKYATDSTRREVVFVNPIKPKGVDIALQLAAARPDLPFRFIRCWPIARDELRELRERVGRLPNVRLYPVTHDMVQHYRVARLVLVPSLVDEAFPRTVLEAQLNGIPALVSTQGGLPEVLGKAGLAVGIRDGIDRWVEALSAIVDDPAAYERFCDASRREGARRDVDPDCCCTKFLTALRRTVDRHRPTHTPGCSQSHSSSSAA
jgi:glycosyltransferase involved in cell wall biosynthesis